MAKRSLITILFAALTIAVFGQTDVRYVSGNSDQITSMVGEDGSTITGYRVPGAYTNDGKSWATAKNNIQDAINDLVNNNLTGEVWVAQGTYYPTETTETSGGSMQYMSFKIPKGITVRGGFRGMISSEKVADGIEGTASVSGTTLTYKNGETTTGTYTVAYAGESTTGARYKITQSTSSVGYYYPYQMILDGRISSKTQAPKFTWNTTKHQYDTEFYGNCYHVVTFATNGFDSDGRAKPLGETADIVAAGGKLAMLEGAMVKNGYAYNAATDGHPHNAYGGGIYMVPGAWLEDVAVENCVASRDGGGVYLDGGGTCCHVYVADCQALGVNLTTGFGGGICVDENNQTYPPVVKRSACINCVAKYGGGLANRVNNPTATATNGKKQCYNQGFEALVISGCTALTEGGGIYAYQGGAFTQCTVARNACYGSGITINGMKTGQSAGVYARDNVIIGNSILWGGSINDDTSKAAQFASSRSKTDYQAEILYVAMNNLGRVDFTGVKSTNPIKLSSYNNAAAETEAGATSNSEEGYVNFLHPLATAGHSNNGAALHFLAYEEGVSNGISYKIQYSSACTNAGVPTTDLDSKGRTPATKSCQLDVFGDSYSSNPSLGAYTSYEPAMSPDVEYTTETTTYATNGKTYKNAIAHVFVDPETTSDVTENVGSAWDKPIKHLTDALNKIGEVANDRLPQIEKYGYTITKIVVHVKEGTTTVQGAGATGSIRESSISIPDITVTRADNSKFTIPLEILGGYKSSIEDDLTQSQFTAFTARHQLQAENRNPILYPTVVTGYVMSDYKYTTPHIFKIEDCTGAVTIDGLQVRYANAWSTELDNTVTTGGAFTITNSPYVTLKNVLVAHCQASNGPAIYETGNSAVSLENCIIHNNTVNVAGISGGNFEKGGIIYTESGSTITLNHCDILRNVGYAFYNDGTVTMDNSLCYANMTTALDDTNGNGDKAMKTFAGSGSVSSTNKANLFDTGSASDTKATAIGTASQKFVSSGSNYPVFINSTKNSGVSEGGDVTYYGLSTSFEPQNTNNVVNAASTGGIAHTGRTSDSSWGTDMSTNINRDYGGLPDIGAVESHQSSTDGSSSTTNDAVNTDGQRPYGTLFYVKDYGTDMDAGGYGMSWGDAINGNAYYYSDGSHGSAPSKPISYNKEEWNTVWSEDATTLPNSNGIVLKNGSSYLVYNGTGLSTTTELGDATLFKIEGGTDSKYTVKAIYNNSDVNLGYDAAGNLNFYTASDWTLTGTTGAGSLGFTYEITSTTTCPTCGGDGEIDCPTCGGDGEIDCPDCYGKYGTRGYYKSGNRCYGCGTCGGSGSGSNEWSRNLTKGSGYIDCTGECNGTGKVTCTACEGTGSLSETAQTTKYIATNGLSTTSTSWTFETRSSEEVKTITPTTETSTGVRGLQYAVNKANEYFGKDNKTYEVWVAAGEYSKEATSETNATTGVEYRYIYKIMEGADVYGGFPTAGNPCKNQRDPKKYESFIETQLAASPVDNTEILGTANVARVLYQADDFSTETMWNGFTIRRGYLNQCFRLNIAGQIEEIIGDTYKKDGVNIGDEGGAGAILKVNGILENCKITQNVVYATSDGSVTYFDGNKSGSGRTGGGYHIGGAGVYNAGGTIKNCQIIDNQLYSYRVSNQSAWAYGSGLFMSDGVVYNTVMSGNDIHCYCVTNTLANQNNDVQAGSGAFIFGGKFYNNTIVDNQTTTTDGHTSSSNKDNQDIYIPGLFIYNGITIYNTIIANNKSYVYNETNKTSKTIDQATVYANGHLVYDFPIACIGSGWVIQPNNIKAQNCCIGLCTPYFATSSQQTGDEYGEQVAYNQNNSRKVDDVLLCYNNILATDPKVTDADVTDASGNITSYKYSLKISSPCINSGTEDVGDNVTIPDEDAAYDDRIQDCTIDIGAYEYNGAYSIEPDVASESGKAIYYVTPDGSGTASAKDPANAACAQKLQKVIDAAGRYKYNLLKDNASDKTQVIVKVANSYAMLHPTSGSADNFTYYATRTTDQTGTDQDVRIWSIIVPRGVEVWGGYTDVPTKLDASNNVVKDTENTTWSNDHNGFYSGSGDTYKDLRDVINNATYFDAAYYNSNEESDAIAYHVVSFSDYVFDGNGTAYRTDDTVGGDASTSNTNDFISLGSTFGRGIVDGIFITGGKANANTSSDNSTNVYGGAAIVNEYGHVRNCIIRDNEGDYGGGLALTKGGLVSGCLIDQNTANKEGGGIYVLTDEENKNLSIASTATPYIYTSTIANNTASVQGGGLHFDDKDNVRVNSSVIWQNNCSDMPNIAGTYAPEKPDDDATTSLEYFPLAYTAVQNLRAAGTSNISVATANKEGVRFWDYGNTTNEFALADDETDFSDFGYYRPTQISALLRTGMPIDEYDALVTSKSLATNDFADLSRKATSSTSLARTYIDIGARALTKEQKTDQLMLRVFVAQPEDVNPDAETDFATLTGDANSAEEYYSQQGSSFAYPFHNLQDALDYVYSCRGCIVGNNDCGIKAGGPDNNANLLPFEIIVAKGTYLPNEDLMGTYSQAYSNTFAIPEGVHIYGGFAVNQFGTNKFYGRYYKAKSTPAVTYTSASADGIKGDSSKPQYITENVEPINGTDSDPNPTSTDKTLTDLPGYTIVEASPNSMLTSRPREDINGNSIIEPWEFQNQTVLSGKAAGEGNEGVFHVITIVADQNVNGVLPPKAVDFSDAYSAADNTEKNYMNHEHGQPVYLNGLTITGGSAMHFQTDVNMDELTKSKYYFGGGLLVDGNRYRDDWNSTTHNDAKDDFSNYEKYNTQHGTHYASTEEFQEALYGQYMHAGVTDGVAYRDLIVNINQCKFIENKAGYGGAIATNSTIDVYNSTFEENLAEYGEDKNVECDYTDGDGNNYTSVDIQYAGQGGAVWTSHQFAAYNTVFANNEARSTDYTLTLKYFKSYSSPTGGTIPMLSGLGGAIFSGYQGHFHLINCDMVRNMANTYPCVFTRNPNTYNATTAEATPDLSTGAGITSINDYNQILNTIAWGNEINATMWNNYQSNTAFKFAAPLICNYGAPGRSTSTVYGLNFGTNPNVPTNQTDLNDATKFAETAWFSAYEEGRGVTCKNSVDIRDAQFRPYQHCIPQIKAAVLAKSGAAGYQNCNVQIDTENNTLDGPNFSDPSREAGTAGYNESADWSPARLNNMTDQGNGRLIQTITKKADETYKCDYPKYSELSTSTINGYWGAEEAGTRGLYSTETNDDYVTSGAYTTVCYMTATNYANTIPLGEDFYMKSLHGNEDQQMLWRISYDPNPTHNSTYIDIGVYEYPHTPLKWTTEGDECDILWVSSEEKPDNGLPEGSAWSQPTSDLQRAIETLLGSRNGHRKEIRLMDGTFAPTYTIEGKQSFYFDTKYINESVVLPATTSGDVTTVTEGLGIKSFTIKGGYSKDLNEQYDIDEYPAIIRQKKQTETGSHRWDYLFYVKDATQRYGNKTAYNADNGYGWYAGTTAAGTNAAKGTAPTTIPIEIEGVTFVNNQSSTGVTGAAICYADQSFGSDYVQKDGATDYIATAPKTANVSLMDADGNRLYWPSSTDHSTTQTTETDYPAYVENTNPYKIILARNVVMNSSAVSSGNITAATYIGKFGGEGLVYNTVFHSNHGDALQAYATRTINNTFALNTGKLLLNDKTGNDTYDAAHTYYSKIYNSVFWKNNNGGSGSTYGKQFNLNALSGTLYDGTSTYDYIKSNSYTGGNNTAIDYDATEDNVIKENNWNTGLTNDNEDAVYGPNFEDPNETATKDDDVEARSFKLRPSLRLLNRGDNYTAHSTALTNGTALYSTGNLTAATPVFGDIYDLAWVTAANTDAASEPRIIATTGGVIDLGAYEYQSKQNRVLYVDPNKVSSGSGLSWSDPLGYGNIQAAIDACAVYYKNEHKQTYVFVKGNSGTNKGKHTGETITMRNGVAVYGSIHSDYLVDCDKTIDSYDNYNYTDDVLNTYVKNLQILHREAVISPTIGHTRILGINANGAVMDETATCTTDATGVTSPVLPMSVVDGFDVTAQTDANTDDMATVTEPVININPKKNDKDDATGGLKMCVSNVSVHGCDYSTPGSGQTNMNLVSINNALLYEALIYNNKVSTGGSVLNVHDYGYAASVTVEGKTTGADGSTTLNNVSGTDNAVSGNTTASHVYNSITNYADDPATWKTLSGYCYKLNHMDLNYQLTENSPYIDAISVSKPNDDGTTNQQDVLGGAATADYKSGGMPSNLSQFINYWPVRESGSWTSADRDLLGNFRLQTLGTVAGDAYNGNDYSSDGSTAYAPKLDRGAFETWDIQQSTKNAFPDFSHAGSVEYIRAGKSFIIDGIAEGGNNNPHNPGFCLLEKGASLYGNGRRVEIPYVSVEGTVNKSQLSVSSSYVMSVPYDMDYDNTTGITSSGHTIDAETSVTGVGYASYDDDGGLIYKRPTIDTYTYNGTSRSATDFQFNDGKGAEHSDCWDHTTSVVPAAHGVHAEFKDTFDDNNDVLYRVTSYSGSYETKVYTEEINSNNVHYMKSVTLTKYDDSESTNDGADFTDANDQGWNCIGLPYLVNKYYPYYKATFNPATTKVSILTPTDEGYSSATAYAMNNPHVMWLYYNGKVDADGNRLAPDGTSTTMGDGGFYAVNSWDTTADAWHMTSGKTPHIWMGEGIFVQNQKFSGDEELKFYIPVAPSLPINSSNASKSSNSSNSSFASEDYCTRYYYDPDGIDDLQADDDNDSDVLIKVIKHTLYVTNLKGGEDIRVFNTAGQLFKAATAESESYQTNVDPGVIIVTVNNKARKVFVK